MQIVNTCQMCKLVGALSQNNSAFFTRRYFHWVSPHPSTTQILTAVLLKPYNHSVLWTTWSQTHTVKMENASKSWAFCLHISQMKMRHDSWHPASISSTPTSCGAAKIRAQKRCLYRHQWINVAQAAVQDWAGVEGGGGRSVGGGGHGGCQLKGWTPAEMEMCT